MISVEKPGSPSEILEHVGVKGMKWGVRKAVDTAIGTKTAGRKPSSYKTKTPKAPQKGIAPGRSSREFRAQQPTRKLQASAIRSAQKESYAREKAIRKQKDSVERARMLRDHMNHPGTAVALRTTRGEKVVATVLLASIRKDMPLTTAAGVGLAGGRMSERRRIERVQRKGGFK
jgi:hypothetical protein